MTAIVFFIALVLTGWQAYAWEVTVEGKVTSVENEPVDSALVTFLDEADSSLVFGTSTDQDGRYQIELSIPTAREEINGGVSSFSVKITNDSLVCFLQDEILLSEESMRELDFVVETRPPRDRIDVVYPDTVVARKRPGRNVPKWPWNFVFEETGGKVGFRIEERKIVAYSKRGSMYTPWGSWPSWGNIADVKIEPEDTGIYDYWISGETFCGGRAALQFRGVDDYGNTVSLKTDVHLTCLPPVANAGLDQTVWIDSVVTLNGSESSSPYGGSLTYRWVAPPGVTLNDSTVVQPTFTASAPGTYRFALMVSYGQVYSEPEEVIIRVIDEVCDFDGSGVVDFGDFFFFSDHFGLRREDENFLSIHDLDGNGVIDFDDFFLFANNFGKERRAKLIALAQQTLGLPLFPSLEQNYPNPFNSSTLIRYNLPESGLVHLEIYNLVGQKVKTLVNQVQGSGFYQTKWNGTDEQGKVVSAGIYFIKLQAGEFMEGRKIMLVK